MNYNKKKIKITSIIAISLITATALGLGIYGVVKNNNKETKISKELEKIIQKENYKPNDKWLNNLKLVANTIRLAHNWHVERLSQLSFDKKRDILNWKIIADSIKKESVFYNSDSYRKILVDHILDETITNEEANTNKNQLKILAEQFKSQIVSIIPLFDSNRLKEVLNKYFENNNKSLSESYHKWFEIHDFAKKWKEAEINQGDFNSLIFNKANNISKWKSIVNFAKGDENWYNLNASAFEKEIMNDILNDSITDSKANELNTKLTLQRISAKAIEEIYKLIPILKEIDKKTDKEKVKRIINNRIKEQKDIISFFELAKTWKDDDVSTLNAVVDDKTKWKSIVEWAKKNTNWYTNIATDTEKVLIHDIETWDNENFDITADDKKDGLKTIATKALEQVSEIHPLISYLNIPEN